MVRAPAHPISCTTIDLKHEKRDTVDGAEPSDSWYKRRCAQFDADSSETDTDSETEMTVIKSKPIKRVGSRGIYVWSRTVSYLSRPLQMALFISVVNY